MVSEDRMGCLEGQEGLDMFGLDVIEDVMVGLRIRGFEEVVGNHQGDWQS